MNNGALRIRLEKDLERDLDHECKERRQTRSDYVRDALRRQLAISKFRRLRARLVPMAEAQGIYTDDDVFRIIS